MPWKPAMFFRHPQFFPRLLAVLLTLWSLALYTPEFYRVALPLSSLGLSVNSNGVIQDVVAPFTDAGQSPAAQAGLKPGDRIDLGRMRCTHPGSPICASLLTILSYSGELEYTRANFRASFDILGQAGSPPRHVTLTAAPAPLDLLDRIILFASTIVGVIFCGITFFLVWERPGRMSWGFFLYAIWFNPGQIYSFHVLLQPWPLATLIEQILEAAAQGAAYAGLLIFALRFPTDAPDPRWQWLERGLPWLGAVLALLTLAWGADLFGVPTETLTNLVLIAGFVIDGAAILLLALRLPSLHPQDEQRMLWAIAGCAIGIPAFLIADICQSTSLPIRLLGFNLSQSTVGLLYFVQGVMAYFVSVAIYRRRVVSVAIPLRRGATLTFLTFLLGVPILYLHDRITHFTAQRDMPSWLWPLVLGPIVLVALARLQDFAANYTERVFNRRYHRARDTLHQANLTIRKAAGFAEIDSLLTQAPAAALRLASVAVFRMIEGKLRRVGPAIGWTDAELQTLDPAEYPRLLAQLLEDKPVRLPRSEWDRPNLPRDDLFPCLAIPIRGGVTESIAVILCGPHRSGADISYDERQLLQEFAAQAALGYDRVEANALRHEIASLRQTILQAEAPPSRDAS